MKSSICCFSLFLEQEKLRHVFWNERQQNEWLLAGYRDILEPEGVIVIADPYSWSEDHTEASKWLGGGNDDKDSTQATKDLLNEYGFQCIHTQETPFIIRDSGRKYQYGVAETLVFQ